MVVRIIGLAVVIFILASPTVGAEATEDVEKRFSHHGGDDDIPPGCDDFLYRTEENPRRVNPCHAIATSMNGLDTPKVDVLLMVPVSPTAERDLRIMRQSVQMWADGIDWMARDMGLDWMADVVEFRISTQLVDPARATGFVSYAVTDPEIVVIVTNPVGGLGIGVDPQWLVSEMLGTQETREGPCHGIEDPFNLAKWMAMPGFDSHHRAGSGTYVEDCDGKGGNVCFSINGAIDPDPNSVDFFQLFDLIAHENGHCMTLGHVGDGAEGSWDNAPPADIMAYANRGHTKCVSSLDVEAFAVTMSKYIDRNGDEEVDSNDRLWANDAAGEGDFRPFQLQHPNNHYYASPTRLARDCIQPSFSPVPMQEVTDFQPQDAVARGTLALQNVTDGMGAAMGPFNLHGRVGGEFDHLIGNIDPVPMDVTFQDSPGDQPIPMYDIQSIHANVTETTLTVVVSHADLRPDEGTAYAQYSLELNGRAFYGFSNMPEVDWDSAAGTITYTFDRQELQTAGFVRGPAVGTGPISSPYEIRAFIYTSAMRETDVDYAPNLGEPPIRAGDMQPLAEADYVTVGIEGDNGTVVPVIDGRFSGNVDLSRFNESDEVVLSATWYTRSHHVIDSDRLLVTVDPDVPVDWKRVHGASAGPGAELLGSDDKQSPGVALVSVLMCLAFMIVRRR